MNSNSALWKIDLALFRRYSFGRSYRIALQHRAKQQDGVAFAYGETPRKTTHAILHMMHLQPTDHFAELGAGIGRMTLYAAKGYGSSATAIEKVPRFVAIGKQIAARQKLHQCTFTQGDIFDRDWHTFSALYLMMTTFPDETIRLVAKKCDKLRAGTRLVTVTHPIKHPRVQQTNLQILDFSWGPATVFVHKVQSI